MISTSVQLNSGCRLGQQARRVVASRKCLAVRNGAERVTQSKKDIIVSPSILSANFAILGEQVETYLAQTRFLNIRAKVQVIVTFGILMT